MRCGHLFNGIGGFPLAARWMGWENVWHSEIDEFCNKIMNKHFPNSICYGDIKTTDWTKAEPVELVTGGFPCFGKGTLIITEDGYKPIEDVGVGEMVMTHKCRYRPVKRTMIRNNARTYNLHFQGVAEPIEATSEHPFYTKVRKYRSKRLPNGNRKQWTEFTNPKWIEANDLERGMYVGYPLDIPTDNDIHSVEFWYLVGRYLGDGWISNHKKKSGVPIGNRGSRINSRHWQIKICCNKDNEKELEEAISSAGFHSTRSESRTTIRFIISNKSLVKFLNNFGQLAHGKHLTPNCFDLSVEKKKALFNGWLDADGYVEQNGRKRVTTTSRKLAYDMARIARSAFKRPVSISRSDPPDKTIIAGREVNQRPFYRVGVSPSCRYGFVEDGFLWMLFKGRGKSKSKTVYNLEVQNDNSYTAEGIAVHNCQPFSQAGRRGGTEDDLYLWPAMFEAIRSLNPRPRWVLAENVYGIVNWSDGMVLETVLSDLEDEGYSVQTYLIPASGIGAPHQRERVWIVGYAEEGRRDGPRIEGSGEQGNPRPTGGPDSNRDSPHSTSYRLQGRGNQEELRGAGTPCVKRSSDMAELLQGLWENDVPKPAVSGMDDGVPDRVDRTKALGNAIVPGVALQIFRTIEQFEQLT